MTHVRGDRNGGGGWFWFSKRFVSLGSMEPSRRGTSFLILSGKRCSHWRQGATEKCWLGQRSAFAQTLFDIQADPLESRGALRTPRRNEKIVAHRTPSSAFRTLSHPFRTLLPRISLTALSETLRDLATQPDCLNPEHLGPEGPVASNLAQPPVLSRLAR